MNNKKITNNLSGIKVSLALLIAVCISSCAFAPVNRPDVNAYKKEYHNSKVFAGNVDDNLAASRSALEAMGWVILTVNNDLGVVRTQVRPVAIPNVCDCGTWNASTINGVADGSIIINIKPATDKDSEVSITLQCITNFSAHNLYGVQTRKETYPCASRGMIEKDFWKAMDRVVTVRQKSNIFGGVIIPDGTEITAVVTETITSETALQGSMPKLKVAEDIKIDGVTVIKEGTLIKGLLFGVDRAGKGGRTGKLEIKVDSTSTVDNKRIKLKNDLITFKGKSAEVLKSGFAMGPFALLKKGYEAEILEGTKIKLFTDEQIMVVTENANNTPGEINRNPAINAKVASDSYDALIKLKDLKDKGILTEEEYEVRKKEILKRY